MSYFINQTKAHSLTINGVDYTDSLVSWQCSDASANKQGIISTTGSLTLGQQPGGYSVTDYDRNNFKRGAEIILTIQYEDGTIARHPRGLLYVVSTAYDPDNRLLNIEMGCRLALAALTEEVDSLLPLSPIYLDPTQQTYQGLSASLSAAGMYLYQNNTGSLVSGVFFDADDSSGFSQGEWVSVLGVTTLAVNPLAGSGALPDRIELSYLVPSDGVASDKTGTIDIAETESYYYTTYPAIIYQRVGDGLSNISGTYTGQEATGSTSSCGNTPPKPADNGTPSCNEGYELVQSPLIIPAYKKETTRTEYNGPAAQVSRIYSEIRGPAIEANSQYFADKFAYCRYTWATACNPNGSCPLDGEEEILLSYSEQLNYYGSANELVKTVVDNYETQLSAAQPFNWRSGVVNGIPQDFTTLSTSLMYRSSRQETVYAYNQNGTVQETTTYTSIAASGTNGITGDIDALSGIRTFQRRTSTTISTNPIAPDSLNTPQTSTETKTDIIYIFADTYVTPPNEAGPYILKEQVPVPLLSEDENEIATLVSTYSNHLSHFVRGEALGLNLAESLRKDIGANWYPGMPFRYYDVNQDVLMAMRMDATTWGVGVEGAVLATNGIWVGDSNGSVTIGSNVVGDSRPDMGSGGAPPSGPSSPPSVSGETSVVSGAYAFDVNVHFALGANVDINESVSQGLASETIDTYSTFTCFVGGLIVQSGGLLATDANGSIPIEYLGSLVTSTATIVAADIFG